MPAQDTTRNAPRRAIRRVNQQRAVRVRHDRTQLVQRLSAPPPVSGADQARTGARAGVRPRPARPTPARRTRPSFVGPTPEQSVRKAVSDLVSPGGHLKTKERAADQLRDAGLIPGLGPQERRQARIRAAVPSAARQAGLKVEFKDGRYHYYRRDPLLGGIFHKQTEVFPTASLPGGHGVSFGEHYSTRDIAGTGVLGNALKDALDFAAETPTAVYHLGDLAVHGNARGVADALIEPYKQLVKHPIRSFEEHPVQSGLLLGPLHGVSRGIGRVTEAADRPVLTVPGTSIAERRPASSDYVVRRVQARQDRQNLAKAERLRREADQVAESDPHRADDLLKQAADVDPRIMSGRQVSRRMDELVSLNEGMRRQAIAGTPKDVRTLVGRNPSPVLRLIAERIVAPTRKDLQAYHDELVRASKGLKGSKLKANQKTRAAIRDVLNRNVDLGEVAKVAENYARISVAQQGRLRATGLLGPDSEIARHVPYAVRNMGVKHDPAHWEDAAGNRLKPSEVQRMRRELTPAEFSREAAHVPDRLIDSQGRQVSLEQIRSHMQERGVGEPAFITQSPGKGGRGNFFTSWEQRRLVGGPRRTGEATLQGTMDVRPEALTETPAKVEGLVEAHRGFVRFLNDFAYRDPTGDVHPFRSLRSRGTEQGALDVARDLKDATGMEWQPVRIHPFGAGHGPLHDLLEQTRQEEIPQVLSDRIHNVVSEHGEAGPWALVPKDAASTLGEHMRNLGASAGGRVWQAYSQAFRRTVLSLSPSWATGNLVEAGVRSILNRAGPMDRAFAGKVLKRLDELDPMAAREMRERVGAGHYGFAGRTIKRDPSQWATTKSSKAWQRATEAMGKLSDAPPAAQVIGLWNLWADSVFSVMGKTEAQPRMAMLGQALKRDGIKSIDQAAQGLRNTNEQVRFARAVDRAYGQYDKFNPKMRRWIALYTPFAAWFLNSVKFITQVLPQDHPVVTSLLASADEATEKWRKQQGLSAFVTGAPGFLQGSFPVKGGHIRFQYTPFAAFNDPLDNAAGLVLPQFSGALMAMRGLQWNGDPLPKGSNKGEVAIRELLAATVPIIQVADRIANARGSTLKQKLNVYNPVRVMPENTRGSSGGTVDTNPLHKAAHDAMRQQIPGGLSLDELNKRAQQALRAGR